MKSLICLLRAILILSRPFREHLEKHSIELDEEKSKRFTNNRLGNNYGPKIQKIIIPKYLISGGYLLRWDKNKGVYVYDRTGEPSEEQDGSQINWKCPVCGKHRGPSGHDPCIENMPGVSYACCGHGFIENAYVKMDDGTLITEKNALKTMRESGYNPPSSLTIINIARKVCGWVKRKVV